MTTRATRFKTVATQEERRAGLRELMRRSGLTMDDFTDIVLAGRTRRTLYRWLSGESPIGNAPWSWMCRVAQLKRTGRQFYRITVRIHRILPPDPWL